MKLNLALYFLFIFIFPQLISAQYETYTIKKTLISSEKYDEFSPVYYKNGLVFCTNRNQNVSNYSDSKNRSLFKINYIDTTGKVRWQDAGLLSKDLTTRFNDGPVTFNTNGDTIYYSRNLNVDGKISELSGVRNKLGIFSAVLSGGKWSKVRELRFNNEWYNVTTPSLSSDGKRLFFASDKPGGYGGYDLYCCYWKNDYWENPVNLGPVINTIGNEVYPFINQAGELYFSSDGHPGLGGKDIFFSISEGKEWLTPVPLDPPINSTYDDFGIVTDSTMNEGFFSSKRGTSVDVYHFKTNFPQIFYSKNQNFNQYCFRFKDKGDLEIDPVIFQFEWEFGDGSKTIGPEVEHCFPQPGNYLVTQNIIEKKTGKIFFTKLSYYLAIRDVEQPFISGPEEAITGEVINFDGLKSYLSGTKILAYSWDFGDSEKAIGGIVSHVYKVQGEYIVRLGLTVKEDSSGIIHKTGVSRKINVFKDSQGMASFKASMKGIKAVFHEADSYEHATVRTKYSAAEELRQGAVFQVEILSSKIKADINSNLFKNILSRSYIKVIKPAGESIYSYIIHEDSCLMDTWLVYKEAIALGFKDTRIRTFIPKDQAEQELLNLKKVFGVSSDIFFVKDDIKTSLNAYPLLDQIVALMKKYPEIRLEIAAYTDNTGSALNNLQLSQKRAESMTNYMIGRGINNNRLIAKGFGSAKPIASNLLESDRWKNRRIEFTIIQE